MQTNKCDQECEYFKWSEVGANFKAYCTRGNQHVKNLDMCPKNKTQEVIT